MPEQQLQLPLHEPQHQPAQHAAAGKPRFQASKTVTISDRQMALQLSSTPAFDAEVNQLPSWLLLLGGSLVSALLSLLLWQQATGRRRAETLARGMTQDLDRLAQVVQHTSNAVSIQDRDMRIVWINEGFTRITGYAAADAIGLTRAGTAEVALERLPSQGARG